MKQLTDNSIQKNDELQKAHDKELQKLEDGKHLSISDEIYNLNKLEIK